MLAFVCLFVCFDISDESGRMKNLLFIFFNLVCRSAGTGVQASVSAAQQRNKLVVRAGSNYADAGRQSSAPVLLRQAASHMHQYLGALDERAD